MKKRISTIVALMTLGLVLLAFTPSDTTEHCPVQHTTADGDVMCLFWSESDDGTEQLPQAPELSLSDLPADVREDITGIPTEAIAQLPDDAQAAFTAMINDTANDILKHISNCTLTANNPYKVGNTVAGSGSLYCQGDVAAIQLVVHLEKRSLGFWWSSIASTDTGWQEARYLGRSVNTACLSGKNHYRIYVGGAVRRSNGATSSASATSATRTWTC